MCSNRIRSPCLTSTTSFSLGLISSLYGFISHLLFSSLCVYVVIWIVRASIKHHSRQVKTPKCKRRMQKTGPKERKKEDKSKIILKTRTESNGKWNICLKCIAFCANTEHWTDQVYVGFHCLSFVIKCISPVNGIVNYKRCFTLHGNTLKLNPNDFHTSANSWKIYNFHAEVNDRRWLSWRIRA